MGCEKVEGGFVSTTRSSMERRRISNAKIASFRQRKHQEVTMEKEQEKLQRAKEILERRKSERDRLSAHMLSPLDNPQSKHLDHLNGMRRLNLDGMFGRPQWIASLQSDYETLIKLREKEIDVATLKIENHKQIPCKNMQSKDDTNEKDKSFLLNEEFELHQEALEQEFGDSCFDSSKDSFLRNDMEDLGKLEHELFSFANETEKHCINTRTDLLLIEPTVFREQLFNGQKTGAGSLPPRSQSFSKVVIPPLKSCLKSIKENQKSVNPTPKQFSQAPSERTCSEASQATRVATLDIENAIMSVSNAPQRNLSALRNSEKIMTVMNPCDTLEDMDLAKDLFEVPFDLRCKEHSYQAANNLGLPLMKSTISNVESLEKQISATDSSANAFSKFEVLGPKLSRQMGGKRADGLPWSGIDTEFQMGDLHNCHASLPSDSFQLGSTIHSAIPPRYTSTSKSWQEENNFDSSIPDECYTQPLQSSSERYENKNWGAEEESLITSLDSEVATTRLHAEVAAIQLRLEDCKLKPWDFEDIFEEPYYPGRDRRWLEQCCKNEMTPSKDISSVCFPLDYDHELVNSQNEEGTFDMNIQNHEIVPTENLELRESILNMEVRIEEKIGENAINANVASSADDHDKEVLTTTPFSSDQKDNFTKVPISGEIQSTEKLHGAAWEIPWKSEGQQRAQEEPSVDQGVSAGKNEQPTNSTVVLAPSKPVGSTIAVDFHSEKVIPLRVSNDQQLRIRHVTVQTDNDLKKCTGNPRFCLGSSGVSINLGVPYIDRFENTANLTDRSLLSTEKTSKYLNIGYRDLSVAPRRRHRKRSFFSSQGLLQVGYLQPRQSPQPVKQNVPQNNRQAQACGFRDFLSDKENWGMSGPDDQELSILASLERLDWKLAAISARAKNQTNNTPSLVYQEQIYIQSAPAATREKGVSSDTTREKFPVNQLRPSVRCSSDKSTPKV